MAFFTGFFHPRLLRQYGILTVHTLVFLCHFAGLALVIRQLARGGSLWLISLLFILSFVTVLVQTIIWFFLVMSDYFWMQPVGRALTRYWHLPQKKGRELWLQLKHGCRQRGIYSHLDSTRSQIRLLVITPGQGSEDIVCRLLPVELCPKPPKYEALSYTWGLDYSPCHIVLNNSAFTVTPNLYGALKYLRFDDVERIVWIDALCIDQSNIVERGEQVSMMKEIYSHAAETIIWLGDETSTSNLAMKHLSLASTANDFEAWFTDRLQTNFDNENLEWKAVLGLFRMDYWRRVWIIQETAVSSKLSICCGQYSIVWELAVGAQNAWITFRANATSKELQVAIEVLEDLTITEGTFLRLQRTPRHGGPMPLSTNRDRIANAKASHLLDLLRDNWSALATDPRDKIYALLGLATDCRTPLLKANYSSSQIDTYLVTMNYLLCNHGNLNIIIYSGIHVLPFPSSFYRVPSWIPTFYWAWEAPTTAVSSQYIYKSVAVPFAASGVHKAIASFQPSFRRFDNPLGIHRVTLRAQACRIDRIFKRIFNPSSFTALSPELSKLKKSLNITTDWLPSAVFSGLAQRGIDRALVDQVRTIYYYFVHNGRADFQPETFEEEQEIAKRTDILWRTLVFNRTFDGDIAPDSWASLFSVLIHGPSSLPLSAHPTSTSTTAENQNLNSHHDENEAQKQAARAAETIQPLLQTIRNLEIGKRFLFLTEKGNIGIANNAAKEGDYICVVLGCAMPMVVTPTGGSLPRVGDVGNEGGSGSGETKGIVHGAAYLHEYMYGKAIEEIEKGELGLEWFDFI